MFDKFIIGSAADSLKISDPLSAYSRVTLKVADGVEYTAGTDSGKELISENPWGCGFCKWCVQWVEYSIYVINRRQRTDNWRPYDSCSFYIV